MSKSTLVRSLILLAYALVAYALIFWQGETKSDDLQVYIVSILAIYFAFGMGVAGQLIFDWRVERTKRYVLWQSSLIVLFACAILVLVRIETIICVAMALPIGLIPLALGIAAARGLIGAFDRARSSALLLLIAPVLLSGVDHTSLLPEKEYAVITEVIIEASPEQIWALAENVTPITSDERPMTLTHTLMNAPKPLEARTENGVRHAIWTKGVYFEEVIIDSRPGETLGWTFHFPDLDAMRALDYRVSPVGPEVVMKTGRYDFTPLRDGQTKVTLTTTYQLKTPLNAYFAAWGQLFVNDFHMAVLGPLKARAEE